MTNIQIYDRTLLNADELTFKEKVEIACQLEKLGVSVIELDSISDNKADALLIKSILSCVKNANISIKVNNEKDIENACKVVKNVKNVILRIELPLSCVGMEYECHKKAPKMLEYIKQLIDLSKNVSSNVEFAILDSTRAEKDLLFSAIKLAVDNGISNVSIYDNACEMLPNEIVDFCKEVKENCPVELGVCFDNLNGFALSSAIMSISAGVSFIKVDVVNKGVSLQMLAKNISSINRLNATSTINQTQINKIVKVIENLISKNKDSLVVVSSKKDINIKLDKFDSKETVKSAIIKLGYDLSEEDINIVYEEVLRVAEKKIVGEKELGAIIASCAMQVPATYKLVSYIINSGNTISASSQMTILKGAKTIQSACLGDGPIDASFKTLEQLIGRKFELDDFQIQSVTEGKEAMGSALVKLRANGKIYSGNGISTDIIGASIRAYISAVNKIVYEEK